jgi:hypothetical protein
MSTPQPDRTAKSPPQQTESAVLNPEPVSNRKPPHLTWESFAERRIREAAEAGAFSNLPGLGQPIPGIDEPLNENWWVRKKLRAENLSVVPPTIAARRQIERFRSEMPGIVSEQHLRRRLEELNEQIRKAIYSTTLGPADGVQLLDVEAEVAVWLRSQSVR